MKPRCTPYLTALAALLASAAMAAPEATVLFAQPGTQVIDPTGVARSVKRGDVLQTGERLITPASGISQIKLLDGSLVGLRPDSELKMVLPPPAADKALQVVSLTKGAVHVIGAELMDDKKPSRFTLQSGQATLQLKGADLESSIVPPSTGTKPQGGSDAGSYNRMVVGTGSIANGDAPPKPLILKDVILVDGKKGSLPIVVDDMPTPKPAPDPAPRPGFPGPTPKPGPDPTPTPTPKPPMPKPMPMPLPKPPEIPPLPPRPPIVIQPKIVRCTIDARTGQKICF